MCVCLSVCVSTCVSCILISQISEYMNLSGRKYAGEEPETVYFSVYCYDNGNSNSLSL